MTIKKADLIKARRDNEYHKERDIVRITTDDGTEYWIGEDECIFLDYLKRVIPK